MATFLTIITAIAGLIGGIMKGVQIWNDRNPKQTPAEAVAEDKDQVRKEIDKFKDTGRPQ